MDGCAEVRSFPGPETVKLTSSLVSDPKVGHQGNQWVFISPDHSRPYFSLNISGRCTFGGGGRLTSHDVLL